MDILESIDDGEEINIEDDGVESGGEEGEGKDVVVLEEIGEESSSDEEAEFPNTLITFSHISGDKLVCDYNVSVWNVMYSIISMECDI